MSKCIDCGGNIIWYSPPIESCETCGHSKIEFDSSRIFKCEKCESAYYSTEFPQDTEIIITVPVDHLNKYYTLIPKTSECVLCKKEKPIKDMDVWVGHNSDRSPEYHCKDCQNIPSFNDFMGEKNG